MMQKRIIVLVACLFGPLVQAAPLTDDQLSQIEFDQKLGSLVSSNLLFKDEAGNVVHLGDCIGDKPSVLILGYYGCPMLCTLVLNGAADCFRNMTWKSPQQFNVMFVSIDPTETPPLAAEKKSSYMRAYGNATAGGWHFLTGNQDSISNLTDKVGFRYSYDTATKQFAHPSGLVILTPEGKVARYFFGVNFAAKDVDSALRNAAVNQTGTPEPQFTLLCFHYAPIHGKYGKFIMYGVRAGGILMVFCLAGLLLISPNKDKTLPSK